MKARLAKFPKLRETETIIDEWNMSLDHPRLEPAYQPAFILENTLGFLETGLSRSAYYHIRDSFVDEHQFAAFMSPKGAEFVARWWNDVPQYDGLFDNQGQVRPAYYAFKLLSLIRGQRLKTVGATSDVRALAARSQDQINVVIWNFPQTVRSEPVKTKVRFAGNQKGRFRLTQLTASSHLNQLELKRAGNLSELQAEPLQFDLAPYEIAWISID